MRFREWIARRACPELAHDADEWVRLTASLDEIEEKVWMDGEELKALRIRFGSFGTYTIEVVIDGQEDQAS